jgi:hypothetical protein
MSSSVVSASSIAMSSSFNVKCISARFSGIRLAVDVLARSTRLFCKPHRNMIWAGEMVYFAARSNLWSSERACPVQRFRAEDNFLAIE